MRSSVILHTAILCFPLVALAACSGTGGTNIPGGGAGSGGSGGGAGSGGTHGGGGSGGTGGSAGAGGTHGSGTSGPVVNVRVQANQNPFPATDSTSRETPSDQRMGILGLELMTSPTDPSPVTIFHVTSPVDTGFNAGDDTLVGSVVAKTLPAGHFSYGRVPVAYVKFTVDGTYHYGSLALPGQFSDAISLSANTSLDGATRDQGWWSASFSVSGKNYGAVSGEGADIGQPGSKSGIHLDTSTSTGAYVIPLDVTIDPAVDHDMTILFLLNTYEDFHWTDESKPGYAPGVFDVSYGVFEPVTQLGANSVVVTMD